MSKISNKLNLHLAALATATAGVAAVTNNADAAVVYSGMVNINIPSTTAGVYLNLVTGVSNANPASVPGWDFNPWSSSALNMFSTTSQAGGIPTAYAGSGTTYSNLAVGATIGPASTFASTGTATVNGGTPLNLNSSNNYVGFRFRNEVTGQDHFGWAQIALSGSAFAQPRAIVAYAYEDQPGVAITIPTPGAASMLAVGAAGLIGRRRRA